jgi:hypothetical protein
MANFGIQLTALRAAADTGRSPDNITTRTGMVESAHGKVGARAV